MDYFKTYFDYAGVGTSEAPAIFHRWASLAIIGTLLGRQAYFPFGHGQIYPNQYIMFMGSPGCRKSTAVNIGAKLLKQSGYTRFASDRTSKERFLMDMHQFNDKVGLEELEALSLDEPSEVFVVAEEFTDFVGNNNMEFITMLTKLWDCPAEYTNPKIHGKSVVVTKPTVSILSGNTAQGFSLAFPAEALGNGFLSRMILVHGETTGRKVTFPAPPDDLLGAMLVDRLKDIKAKVKGPFKISSVTEALCDRIYKEFVELDDHRFRHYATRRFTHLLKIAMIIAAADLRKEILPKDMLHANTVLHYTERKMPKALGEFGKGRNSDVSNTILEILDGAIKPLSIQDLWKKVGKDLNKMADLADIMKNLMQAERVQTIANGKGGAGFMPLKKAQQSWASELLAEDWLTEEEMML